VELGKTAAAVAAAAAAAAPEPLAATRRMPDLDESFTKLRTTAIGLELGCTTIV
jgi:hypothetical protein